MTCEQQTQGHVHRNCQIVLTTDMTDHLGNAPFEKQSKETTFGTTTRTKVLRTWGRERNGEKKRGWHMSQGTCA